jgi:hypothetical protein
MAPFEVLMRTFRTGLASPFKTNPTDMLQLINIELEDLDHEGRRSMERKKRRGFSFNFVAVRLLQTSQEM